MPPDSRPAIGVPGPTTPQDFAAFIADQTQRWREVSRVTGVTVQ
jgi:hypothetical protein